jgi:hypothetical protein
MYTVYVNLLMLLRCLCILQPGSTAQH